MDEEKNTASGGQCSGKCSSTTSLENRELKNDAAKVGEGEWVEPQLGEKSIYLLHSILFILAGVMYCSGYYTAIDSALLP